MAIIKDLTTQHYHTMAWCQVLHSIHQKRALLQCAILILNLSFYVYLRCKSVSSNNWKTHVGYCFAQKGMCTSRGSAYGIARSAAGYHEAPPLCYSATGNDENICFSNKKALDCTASMWQSHSPIVLEDLFEDDYSQNTYFDYDVVILALTTILIVLTSLFHTSKSSFVSEDDDSFSTVIDSIKIHIACGVLTAIVVALMLTSSQTFTLIRVVSCGLNDKPNSGDGRHMHGMSRRRGSHDRTLCQSCNSDVRSVLFPQDVLVEHYPAFAMTLAFSVLVVCLYTLMFPPTTADCDEEGFHGHAADENGYGDDSFRFFARTASGNMATTRYSAAWSAMRMEGSVQSAADVFRDHSNFKQMHEHKMQKWRVGFEACGLGSSREGEECVVCLDNICPLSTSNGNSPMDGRKRKPSAGMPISRATRCSSATVVPVQSSSDSGVVYHVPVRLPCGHLFHEKCVRAWMRSNNTCPICRADLVTGNIERNGNM